MSNKNWNHRNDGKKRKLDYGNKKKQDYKRKSKKGIAKKDRWQEHENE